MDTPRRQGTACATFSAGRSVALALIILAALVTGGTARADLWYEDYEKAERASAAGNWPEAIARLNLALESKGDSSARARTYGMNFRTYFPYFRLGVAYYNMGQLDAALQAFDTEENLEAIAQSPADLEQLHKYRDLIDEAKANALAEAQSRIRQIVEDNLAQAVRLESNGQLDDAMIAVGKALAVAPDDPRSKAALERLGEEITRRQSEQQQDQKIADLSRRGRDRLSSGNYQEAAQLFERALALKASPQLQRLRDEATAKLKAETGAIRDAEERLTMIAGGISDAQTLENTGDFSAALARLQEVLALDESNQDALRLQARLRRAQTDADTKKARSELVQRLQGDLSELAASGNHELILATANRLLALESGNTVAMRHLSEAYRQINRRLLGRGPVENFPPAIRFADFRGEPLDDGLEVQRVSSPMFRLSGTIFDDSPVDLVFEVTRFDRANAADRSAQETQIVGGESSGQQLGANFISQFTLSHSLSPGLSVFKIVASDQQNFKSSSEYAVLYSRPLHRSPWSYAALAVAALSVAGLLYGRRLRQRRRLITRRFNPFIAGAPVMDPELFFGRQRLLDSIMQTIHNNSLLLFGERRIGKTSVQHQIKRRLLAMRDPDYDFFPVYIDLQGTPESRFFSTMAHDLYEDLAPWLDGQGPSAALTDGSPYDYRAFVADLRSILKTLKKRRAKKVKVVLLIDEVDELNDYDPRINQKLRSLFMKSFAENLVAVVSGVGIKKHWESEGSPWYNFFEEIEVKPFSPEDAEKLITRPIQGVFQLDPGVVDRIVSLTDCRPYLIQKLCIAVVNRLHQEGRRRITVADVDSIGRPKEA